MCEVTLQPIALKLGRSDAQAIAISLATPHVTPAALGTLALPADLDPTVGVVLYGRAPIWLYSYLVNRLAAFPWVACCDLRCRAAIVVSSQVADPVPGDRIAVTVRKTPGPAVLIGGPPNSGKSVLANALRLTLTEAVPQRSHYLFRANWDGEGNHTFETPDLTLAEQLRSHHNRRLHHQQDAPDLIQQFFLDRGQELFNIRQMVDLTLVDVGGVPDIVKLPVIEQCTHYLIISNDLQKVQSWRELCDQFCTCPLEPLALIHSVLANHVAVIQEQPLLVLIAGPWQRGRHPEIPDVMRSRLLSLFD